MTDFQHDHPREACGLVAVFKAKNAAELIYSGLFAQQHRGQESAGIVVSDGERVRSYKGMGLVGDVFAGGRLRPLRGHLGIGHVRYSTTGSTRPQNIQPLVAECVDGLWALAHNGNLSNAAQLRGMYQQNGAIFQTGTDSEVLIHLLADPHYRTRPRRVARALAELQGAFSFVMMTSGMIMAARDPMGFKPLVMGEGDDGAVIFASETCALKQIGARFLREVAPGELVCVDETGVHSDFFAEATTDRLAQCVFELVYFARPDSSVFGHNVHQTRVAYGMSLAKEHPARADIVIPVPDSGNSAAMGFSRASGIPLEMGFIRNHYVGRTFIMPESGQRSRGVDMKLAVLAEVVQGKSVVVVDDSIVRGTTSRRRVARLREVGAREVHVRIACPPTRHACFFGIDFPTRAELIAGEHDIEYIRDFIGADSLGYLSLEGLLAPLGEQGQNRFCQACFNGEYRVGIDAARRKLDLETAAPDLGLELANRQMSLEEQEA